jgi:hypothetical protein
MKNIAVLNGARALVGDRRRALFLEKHGDLDLSVIEARVEDNPARRDQGTDAPGRAFATRGGHRGSVESADWREPAKELFADRGSWTLYCGSDRRDADLMRLIASAAFGPAAQLIIMTAFGESAS